MQLLLQDLSCLHGPENQIELIEIYTDVPSETNKLLLNFEILPSGRRRLGCIDHSDFSQASHHVLIKYRVTFHTDVSEKVAGLFVTQSFDLLVLRQPVATFQWI